MYKERVNNILDDTPITINGDNPWDPQVQNDGFYRRVYWHGSLGLGESYMDGWWDCDELDEFFTKLIGSDISPKNFVTHHEVWLGLKSMLINMQNRSRARSVAEEHYDLNNEFYADMLDENMQYTCGYWRNADNVEDAQRDKMDVLCRKMKLADKESIVEFGGGWGGLAKYAAEEYDVEVDVYNISEEQVSYAREHNSHPNVTYHLQDYRDAAGTYDACYSVGFFEHVGYKNYEEHFDIVKDLLADDGIAMVQTIGSARTAVCGDAWSTKYIFPNGMVPSGKQLTEATEGKLLMEDWHNYGPDYAKTLMAWLENFRAHWDDWEDEFDDEFKRMWEYYLQSFAGAFRSRELQLWNIIYSKKGGVDEYRSER